MLPTYLMSRGRRVCVTVLCSRLSRRPRVILTCSMLSEKVKPGFLRTSGNDSASQVWLTPVARKPQV